QRGRSGAPRQVVSERRRVFDEGFISAPQGRGAGMIGSAVGKRYATALYELAHESGAVDPIGKGLADFANAWASSEELRHVFENPQFSAEAKKQLVQTLAARIGAPPLLKN